MSNFQDLNWTYKYIQELIPDPSTPFPRQERSSELEDSMARQSRQVSGHYTFLVPEFRKTAPLIGISYNMLKTLGMHNSMSQETLDYMSGKKTIAKGQFYTTNYGGNQFGIWNGQLGDGRVIHFGEVNGWSYCVKGLGHTPFSKHGDGCITLKSALREFIGLEFLNALSVPTTRALSLHFTDTEILRNGELLPSGEQEQIYCGAGGLLSRLAPSWIRFGTFELFHFQQKPKHVKALADYALKNHFDFICDETDVKNPYAKMFEKIVIDTAHLAAHWQSIGFIHGVLNTDEMSIHGVSLHLGPFAFLDDYDPLYSPNISDYEKRFNFENQPQIMYANLLKLGNALVDLMAPKASVEHLLQKAKNLSSFPIVSPHHGYNGNLVESEPDLLAIGDMIKRDALDKYESTFIEKYTQLMCQKLGLETCLESDFDTILLPLLQLLTEASADYYNFFYLLNTFKTDQESFQKQISFERITCKANKDEAPVLNLLLKRMSQDPNKKKSKKKELIDTWIEWANTYRARLMNEMKEGQDLESADQERCKRMKKVNPKIIPRSWILDTLADKVQSLVLQGNFNEAKQQVDAFYNVYIKNIWEVRDVVKTGSNPYEDEWRDLGLKDPLRVNYPLYNYL